MESKHNVTNDFRTVKGLRMEATAVKGLDDIVSKVAEMTDENNHTEARLMIARDILKDKNLIDVYSTLAKWQGRGVEFVVQMRDSMEYYLNSMLKKKLSPEDFDKVHGAL